MFDDEIKLFGMGRFNNKITRYSGFVKRWAVCAKRGRDGATIPKPGTGRDSG